MMDAGLEPIIANGLVCPPCNNAEMLVIGVLVGAAIIVLAFMIRMMTRRTDG